MTDWLTTLANLRSWMNETADTHDDFLELLISGATADMETYTGRKLRERTYGSGGLEAEYRDGNGKSFIYTNQHPIISVTSLYDDIDNNYTSSYLFDSTDYYIYKDLGKILLLSDASLGTAFCIGRANIKIIYTAGYGTFEIIENRNDNIDFLENSTVYAATLDSGIYSASDLATEIKTQMDDKGGDTYTVTYDRQTALFTIASDGDSFTLKWNDGANIATSAARTLGYSTAANDSGDTSYESDLGVPGIPRDLEKACKMLCVHEWNKSAKGAKRFGLESQSYSSGVGTGTTKYTNPEMPPEARRILDRYRNIPI